MSHAGCVLTPILGIRALLNMSPVLFLQYLCFNLIQPVLCSLMIVLLGAGFVVAAELDDSSLFVEAFTAYQKKDYLLAIDKIGTIHQLYPDTPLRDVTLLLLARSGLKSGDNQLAARTISRFNSEFAANPLKATIEEELLRLGSSWQKGERLAPAAGGIIFRMDSLDTGILAEFTMDVKVREDSPIGQELRSRVEVVQTRLQIQEIFTSSVAVVQAE